MGATALAFVARDGADDDPGTPARGPGPRLSLCAQGERGGGTARRFRVLLVEDDPSMRTLCRFNLEIESFEVALAATGAEAIERVAADGPFDLVLLDVMLPDVGGLEVAERLPAGPDGRRPPIVFVSARGSRLDIERGRAAGAIDYVVKPFDPVGLPARLREDLQELERSGPAAVWRLRVSSDAP